MRPVYILITALLIVGGFALVQPIVKNAKQSFLTDFISLGGANLFNSDVSSGEEKRIPNPFENLVLEARSAVVLDLNRDEVIFEKDADVERPLASLVKLVSAAVGAEMISQANSASRDVLMTVQAVAEEGDDGFVVNESFDAADLLDAMLVKSSNDAARALSVWMRGLEPKRDLNWSVNAMNMLASRLGLQKTYFLNNTGLDLDKNVPGASGTAREFAKFLIWLVKNKQEIVSVTARPQIVVFSKEGLRHIFESSAKKMMNIPGLIAVKTGYTDLAGGNVAFAFSLGPGRQFAAVILGSSFEGRFEDAVKIYEASRVWVQI